MVNKKLKIIGMIFVMFVLFFSFVTAAELDLKINAQLEDFDADFYAQTDTGSVNGLDYMDSELRDYPSGNYSFLYSVVGAYEFIIDSWPISSNPRTLNLVYETSPTTVAGTLVFSWNSPGSSYTATLYDYGTDSTRTTLVQTTAMNTLSSYSVAHVPITGKRYLQLKIETTATSGPPTGPGNGDTCTELAPTCDSSSNACGFSFTNTNCKGSCSDIGTACDVGVCDSLLKRCLCEPKCKFESEVKCGEPIGLNGCGTECSGLGTKCDVGKCNVLTKECSTCKDTCASLGYSCGVHDVCGISTDCNPCPLGQTCNAAAKCVKDCEDTCSTLGYNCGTHTICGKEVTCGSCSNGKVCSSGICGEGKIIKIEDIPLTVPVIGKIGCTPSPACSDFGECSSNYNVNNLITGDQVSGIKTRECTDKNNCIANFVLKEPCILKQEVYTVNKVWCGKNYTEVRDASGKVLARLRSLADGKAVSVDFNLESEGYCPSCYDGIKNGDEIAVDCGGSCISCDYKKEKLVWYKDPKFLLFASLAFFLIFLISFSEVAMQTYRYYKDRILLHIFMRRYHGWKRKGYDASVLHRDYSAIKRHYDELKRRLN